MSKALGEGELRDWKALAVVKNFSTGESHFITESKVRIMPSKYLHARLKCCDDGFATDPQYIFQALDWIERNTVANTIYFIKRKKIQTDFNVGCLQNQDNVMHMITDDQIFASFKIYEEHLNIFIKYFLMLLLR